MLKLIKTVARDTKEAGFDLTDIEEGRWGELLVALNLSSFPRFTPEGWLVWQNDYIIIVTSSNPLEGNYAGYIGITGDEELVELTSKFIKTNGNFKDFNSTKREFI